jgi:hypothetical protein
MTKRETAERALLALRDEMPINCSICKAKPADACTILMGVAVTPFGLAKLGRETSGLAFMSYCVECMDRAALSFARDVTLAEQKHRGPAS